MTNPEFNRLREKLSYQGKSLQLRIKKKMKELDQAKQKERDLRKLWLSSQVEVMSVESELSWLCELSNAERASAKED